MQRPSQLFCFFLDGFGAHAAEPLGEELRVGAVQGSDQGLQAALLHNGRACLPDLQDFAYGLAVCPDLADQVVKIAR